MIAACPNSPFNFAPPPGGDPDFASVVLLLPCDGTNGSTTFIDASSYGHTVTPSGNTQITTTNPKFGTGAALFDGSGDHMAIAHNAAFNFGTGDFTIEFHARWTSKSNFQAVYVMGSAAGSIRIQTGDSNGLFTITIGGGVTTTESGAQPDVNVWYHYAFIRSAGNMRIFRDGVQRASNTNSGSISQTATIQIGSTGTGSSFNGRLDDFRVTALARDPADLPPAEAYPTS
jgi:hypothetical protein